MNDRVHINAGSAIALRGSESDTNLCPHLLVALLLR